MAKTNYITPKWRACDECGNAIQQSKGRGKAKKYCSADCKAKVQARKKQNRPKCFIEGCDRQARSASAESLCEMHYYRLRRNGSTGSSAALQGGHENCHYCGKESGGAKFCSTRCSARHQRQHPLTRHCSVCGTEYDPVNNSGRDRLVCSDRCDRARASLAIAVRRNGATGRADIIQPDEVFERDGHRCKSCGVEVLQGLGSGFHPDRAEVDHIIPIAKGGTHTWGNVQTLCSACNRRKGSTMPEWIDESQHVLAL